MKGKKRRKPLPLTMEAANLCELARITGYEMDELLALMGDFAGAIPASYSSCIRYCLMCARAGKRLPWEDDECLT